MPDTFALPMTDPNVLASRQRQENATTNYYVETLCSLSTLFRTVGRFIMRSCHAV